MIKLSISFLILTATTLYVGGGCKIDGIVHMCPDPPPMGGCAPAGTNKTPGGTPGATGTTETRDGTPGAAGATEAQDETSVAVAGGW